MATEKTAKDIDNWVSFSLNVAYNLIPKGIKVNINNPLYFNEMAQSIRNITGFTKKTVTEFLNTKLTTNGN